MLIIKLDSSINSKIGSLGEITFPVGMYAYVGSAQNNLEARVKRHLRKEKNTHWHIDYLLTSPTAHITQVYYLAGDKTCECQTAQFITKHSKPLPNFGCSDCNCLSHLFYSDSFIFLKNKLKLLNLTNMLHDTQGC